MILPPFPSPHVACHVSCPPGHRLRVHVAREGVTIAMAPSGLRTPQRPMPSIGGRPAQAGEPYGLEAYQWTREHFNQREVWADRQADKERVLRSGLFSAGCLPHRADGCTQHSPPLLTTLLPPPLLPPLLSLSPQTGGD